VLTEKGHLVTKRILEIKIQILMKMTQKMMKITMRITKIMT